MFIVTKYTFIDSQNNWFRGTRLVAISDKVTIILIK